MITQVLREGVRTRKDRLAAAAGAFILMCASMLMGMTRIPGSDAPLILWLVLAALSVVVLKVAFPDVWNYVFWLLLIYAFAFTGMVFMTAVAALYPAHEFWVVFAGVFIEMLAVWIFAYLVMHVKSIRDEVAGIADKSAASARLKEETFDTGRYVPLGLWTLSVGLFLLMSNASAAGWYFWASGRGPLAGYILAELGLFAILLHTLWVVQTRFSWGERPDIIPRIGSLVQPAARASGEGGRPPHRCPACQAPVSAQRRMCRSCGRPRDFYWCSRSEHYLIRCPNCRRYTTFGKDRCGNCGANIPDRFTCPCGARNAPRRWPRTDR